MLQFAREMLAVVSSMQYPEGLGKMEMRIGIHVGPLYAGESRRFTGTGTHTHAHTVNNNSSRDVPQEPGNRWVCHPNDSASVFAFA